MSSIRKQAIGVGKVDCGTTNEGSIDGVLASVGAGSLVCLPVTLCCRIDASSAGESTKLGRRKKEDALRLRRNRLQSMKVLTSPSQPVQLPERNGEYAKNENER